MSDPLNPVSKEAEQLYKPKSGEGRSLFEIFPTLRLLKDACDYLGGSLEKAPAQFAFLASPWWSGIWWGILAAFILLFCGQTSKFIYIDF